MMTGEVDVNERLNGLVHLLQVVGIDGVNPDALVEQQKRLNSASNNGDSGATVRSSSGGSSSDAQILEIIKKLQQAQADSPEILAALRSPELRALASLAAQKQAVNSKPKPPAPAPTLDDVMDDDDNYPKIGPGYSDDISVVSDLTTPTVMTRQQVADEEFYRDVNGGPGSLPPMLVGGAIGIAQPARNAGNGLLQHSHHGGKTKNMVGQVNPGAARRAIAKTGGAAAQRRLNYQMAMTKLQSTDGNNTETFTSPKKQKGVYEPTSPSTTQNPMEFPSMGLPEGGGTPSSTKKKTKSKKSKKTALAAQEVSDLDFEGTEPIRTPDTSASSGVTNLTSKKKIRDKTNSNDVDWGTSGASGWPAFDAASPGRSNKDIFVDGDGFFPKNAFSPNGGSGRFATSTSSTSKPASSNSRRDESFGEKKVSRDDGQVSSRRLKSPKTENEWASEDRKKKDKTGKKKSRRASLSM
jgi:hypothetical protein